MSPAHRVDASAAQAMKGTVWTVDYVVTHSAPTGIQRQLGREDADALTDYLETIRRCLSYRKWFFGHYHANRQIDDRHALLYDRLERLR